MENSNINRILSINICKLKTFIQISVFSAIFLLINTTLVKADDIGITVKIGDIAMLDNSAGSHIHDVSESASDSTIIGSTIFNDTNGNFIQDANEKGTPGIHVQLFDEKGMEINVGPDGILGNLDDSAGGVITDENGHYHFHNITQNFYRIRVSTE